MTKHPAKIRFHFKVTPNNSFGVGK